MKIVGFLNSKNIRVATIGGVLVKFLSALFAFVNGILLARLLTLKDFGIYTIAFITANILLTVVSYGLPNLLTFYVSQYLGNANYAALKGILIRASQFVFSMLVMLFAVSFITYLFFWQNESVNFVETMWVSLLLVPVLAFGGLRSSVLRGFQYIILAEMPDTLIRNFLFFIALFCIYLLNLNLSPQEAMLYHLMAGIISFLFGVILLNMKLRKVLAGIDAVFHTKEWFKKATPFAISSNIQILKTRIFNYLITFFSGLEAVAVFEIAFRAANLVSFTLSAINSAINPYIAKAFSEKNRNHIQKIVTRANQLSLASSLPVALIFIIGGEWLLGILFGKEYTTAYIPLIILCIGQLVNAAAGSAGPVLGMTGNQGYLSKNLFQMFVLTVVFSIPLIIYYDTLGAAIAYSLVLIIQNFLQITFIKNRLNIKTSLW